MAWRVFKNRSDVRRYSLGTLWANRWRWELAAVIQRCEHRTIPGFLPRGGQVLRREWPSDGCDNQCNFLLIADGIVAAAPRLSEGEAVPFLFKPSLVQVVIGRFQECKIASGETRIGKQSSDN